MILFLDNEFASTAASFFMVAATVDEQWRFAHLTQNNKWTRDTKFKWPVLVASSSEKVFLCVLTRSSVREFQYSPVSETESINCKPLLQNFIDC
jgi:hypothetical protein